MTNCDSTIKRADFCLQWPCSRENHGKGDNMKQAGRFLSKYIKRNFGVFAIYMLLCILCSILSLIAPYISGNFIDVLLHIEQREQLVKYCVVFATMSFGSIACNYIISQIFARLRIKMNYEINMDFLHHIRKISILTLQKQTTASITQKLNLWYGDCH